MRLDRVEIKNFRSIKDIKIDFNPPCRVLVGINESGKSNILKALRLLKRGCLPVKSNDLRELLSDEGGIDESYVRFCFTFEKGESEELLKRVSDKILAGGGASREIREFCAGLTESFYTVNILDERKSFGCPEIGRGELADLAGRAVKEITEENLPEVLSWEYNEENLLPPSVNVADFSANPDSCLPLRNMFVLAGIKDIRGSIAEAARGTEGKFQDYLNNIARETTLHFRRVCPQYKNTEISLQLNAGQIIPGVKERNTHGFARRSDGFKRFVTFLLMISIHVKSGGFRNTLLLIDEPDTSLHPSGARYLCYELIGISKTNYVVYSTHSIFMVDPGDLSRHLIVKKEGEITGVESAKESNIADEEVLYHALGHSAFLAAKERNIIFEGWNDKHLFSVALENAPAELKEKYKDVGVCHARGVKTIKLITPMIELAKRKCLILSDSDKSARDQRKVYRQTKGFGDWKTYQDISPAIEAKTGEDFVKNDFIAKRVNLVLSGSKMPIFDGTYLPEKRDKLTVLAQWLIDNGLTNDQAKDAVARIKDSIFENLTYSDIDETEYTKLLLGISF